MSLWGQPAHEIVSRFTPDELFELKVFHDRFEPFGDQWRQAAMIAAKIHNAWMTPKIKDESELMPLTKAVVKPRRQSDLEMQDLLMRALIG